MSEQEQAKETGTVLSWRHSWGWIRADIDAKDEVFVHQSKLLMPGWRELKVGQRVVFSRGLDSEGREMAILVTPMQEGN
jgi:cold shock CspA family protein